MNKQPALKTSRLTLRPFSLADAPQVQTLAGDRRVSKMTANMPYPYKDGMAEQWIAPQADAFARGESIVYAVTLREAGELVGTVSVTEMNGEDGNLGYWIGHPYWGNGYCTEAVGALVEFALNRYGLSLIYARHLQENPASGRVLVKNGFKYMGQVSIDNGGKQRVLEHYEKRV